MADRIKKSVHSLFQRLHNDRIIWSFKRARFLFFFNLLSYIIIISFFFLMRKEFFYCFIMWKEFFYCFIMCYGLAYWASSPLATAESPVRFSLPWIFSKYSILGVIIRGCSLSLAQSGDIQYWFTNEICVPRIWVKYHAVRT